MGGRRTTLRAFGVTTGLLLTGVTGAHAASVSTAGECIRADCSALTTSFAADPGEANQLTIAAGGGGTIFSEVTAPIRTGRFCIQRAPTVASCGGFPGDVQLGDGDDQATSSVGGSLIGGAGNDRLEGGSTMNGGPGSDLLTGTGQPNSFIDGDAGDPDVYNGGDGNDTISYRSRSTPVRLTIGAGGTEDTLTSIESASGGSGNDILSGDAGPNTLAGGGGRDTIAAGAGNDTVSLSTGTRVQCGAGRDRVALPGKGDSQPPVRRVSVPADCEIADFGNEFLLAAPPRRKGRSVYLRVRDTVFNSGDSRLRLLVGRKAVGRTRTIKRSGTYRIKLGRQGRRLARRGARVTLQLRSNTLVYRLR